MIRQKVTDPLSYYGEGGAFTDLGNVSGTASVDFQNYVAVKLTLTGNTEITITDPSDRSTIRNRKLIIEGTDQYKYTISSPTMTQFAKIERGGELEFANLATGFSFGDYITEGEVTSPQVLNDTVFFTSRHTIDEGVWQIKYNSFPNDIISFAKIGLNVETEESIISASFVSEDGNYVIVAGDGIDGCVLYNLSTPYDLSTATLNSQTPDLGTDPVCVYLKPDGTSIFTFDDFDYREYSLGTAFDLSTINLTPVQEVSESALIGSLGGPTLYFYNNGGNLLVSDTDYLFVLELGTAYDLSTAKIKSKINIGNKLREDNLYWIQPTATFFDKPSCSKTGDYICVFVHGIGYYVYNVANAHTLDISCHAGLTVIDSITPTKVY